MKRLLIVLAAAGLLASFGLTHLMVAAPPEGKKILVCHIDEIGVNEVVDEVTGEVSYVPYVESAHVISVSSNAEGGHTGHGDVVVSADDFDKGADCTDLEGLDAEAKYLSEMEEGT